MSAQNEKATRYISSLNVARCSGSWNELPELIRKITKHAPQRKCLIRTATAEHCAATHAGFARPGTPAKGATSDLPGLIPSLLSSIDSNTYPSDVFEAQACLAWIHWLLGEPALAISRAPKGSLPGAEKGAQYQSPSSQWIEICQLRSAYIKGASQEATGQREDSMRTLQAILPVIKYHAGQMETNPQLAYWSEQALAQMATTAAQWQSSSDSALEPFRLWASTASKSKEIPAGKYGNIRANSNRVSTWRAYYRLVSDILRQSSTRYISHSSSARLRQATELRQVEAQYEIELLRITRFPQATESNTTVEVWVEQVIQNWSILCGPNWHEQELGAGGRNAVGRNVLDILYRAAGKTFHSTLILRRLFQVHKSLTDFDLAYRAFDTYFELVERDRARAAKDEDNPDRQGGSDGHEDVFRTISEGIEGLCSYGRRSEAQKAYKLATKIQEWSIPPALGSTGASFANGHPNGEVDRITKKTALSEETLGLICRAAGIAEAHWAKWSPFSEDRASLQAKAVSNLARATSLLENDTQYHMEAAYALAMLLAETRKVDQAIECVKTTLDTSLAQSKPEYGYAHERRKLPLWHLLALLLTARQDFETAAQSCNAAFEQFGSVKVLLGSGTSKFGSTRSMSEKGRRADVAQNGLVDDMECTELQRIIETRITELALLEVTEGPEDAVNNGNELLALYYRLFGHLDVGTAEPAAQKELVPPASSAGTVKSFRGSLFGRKKQTALQDDFSEKSSAFKSIPEGRNTRPSTQATDAPTIKINDQDQKDKSPRSHRFRRSGEHSHRGGPTSQKLVRREGSINQAIRRHSQERQERNSLTSSHQQSFGTSQDEAASQEVQHSTQATLDPDSSPLKPQHSIDDVPAPPTSLTQESSPQAKHALSSPYGHSTSPDKVPPSYGDDHQNLEQDLRLPDLHSTLTRTSPVPHFPKSAAQKHALTVLVHIWLVIAKLYRRASLFDDSREACDEAAKATQKIESLVASVESSARAFSDAEWGGGKSSDEVWADVFCDRAELALAVAAVRDADATDETGAGDVREAVEQFEQCLMYYPDHARGIVGLSNVLLDYSEKKVELGRRVDDGRPKTEMKRERRPSTPRVISQNGSAGSSSSDTSQQVTSASDGDELRKTPENLNRLAARDRAYGLLSTLTKLGTGWDDSEAWLALARAHELGGEVDKAKDILWWCVELEDTRPIRHWRNVGCGGYVL